MNVGNRQSAFLAGHMSSQERNVETRGVEAMDCLVDPIRICTGFVSGTVLGDVGNEVRVYRGIPHAAPPVGDLRWRPPQPAAPWSN